MAAVKHSSSDDSLTTGYNCTYSIAVRTSAMPGAETVAFVFVQLIDEHGTKTDRVKLKCSLTHRKKYQRGHSDLFLLVDQPPLGKIKNIEITHNCKESADNDNKTWHLHSVMVIEHDNFLLYRFPCRQWLSADNPKTPSTILLEAEGDPFPIVPVDLSQAFE
ncbi:Polycystic kidney disease and receptor for egg jelly protein [Trichostrongylus colubriformis]|uniref:Polycystic kidney disease and receptor for egg jelly protein n=1 Tax=Trichostrongylus colubriformis TaxID=6319 RepID=A0AAN8EX60_TRICO